MHYKNGRPANNGDKVVAMPTYGAPVIGILYDAVAGNDTCNGKLAPCSPTDPMPNLAECLHLDDVLTAVKGLPVSPIVVADNTVKIAETSPAVATPPPVAPANPT